MFVPCHVINNRGEVGGSIELNRLKALMVSFKNPLHAVTVWVLDVAVLGKQTMNATKITKMEVRVY